MFPVRRRQGSSQSVRVALIKGQTAANSALAPIQTRTKVSPGHPTEQAGGGAPSLGKVHNLCSRTQWCMPRVLTLRK